MKTHLKTKIKHAVFALALQVSPPGDHDRTKRGRNPLVPTPNPLKGALSRDHDRTKRGRNLLVPAPNYLIGAFDLQNYTALKYNCF